NRPVAEVAARVPASLRTCRCCPIRGSSPTEPRRGGPIKPGAPALGTPCETSYASGAPRGRHGTGDVAPWGLGDDGGGAGRPGRPGPRAPGSTPPPLRG